MEKLSTSPSSPYRGNALERNQNQNDTSSESPLKKARWSSPSGKGLETDDPVNGALINYNQNLLLSTDMEKEYSLNFKALGNDEEADEEFDNYDPFSYLSYSNDQYGPSEKDNYQKTLPDTFTNVQQTNHVDHFLTFNHSSSSAFANNVVQSPANTTDTIPANSQYNTIYDWALSNNGSPEKSPPHSPSASSPVVRQTVRSLGKNKTVKLINGTWYKSAFGDEILKSTRNPNLVDTYCEWAEYQILKTFSDNNLSSSLIVCETILNSQLEFTQNDLPEEIDNKTMKDTIYQMFIDLARLWETGHFIIPDIKEANICADRLDGVTLRPFLIDWNFPRHRYDEFGYQVKTILNLNIEEGNLTQDQTNMILNNLRSVIIKDGEDSIRTTLLDNISTAIQTNEMNNSFNRFKTTFEEEIRNKQAGYKPFNQKDDSFTPLDHLKAKTGQFQNTKSADFLYKLYNELDPQA